MNNEIINILNEAKLLTRKYNHILSRDLKPVYDNYSALVISSWRNEYSNKNSPLHNIISRVGGFPPFLARYFIAAFSKEKDIVLDPFCGKGTALLEAAIMGRYAIGGDIATDAVIVSRAKCNPPSITEITNYIQELKVQKKVILSDIPDKVMMFYSKNTLIQILNIREQLKKDMLSRSNKKMKTATFVCALMLGILHGKSRLALSLPCNQCFAMSPNYVRKYVSEYKLKKPDRDVKMCLLEKALEVLPAPKIVPSTSVFEISADKCDSYMKKTNESASLILTSPPYLDRQTYLRDAWLRLWFLGRDWQEIKKVSFETSNVRTFLNSMEQFFKATWQVLKNDGRIVLVCGKAKINVGKEKKIVKISDICLFAIEKIKSKGFEYDVEFIITDRIQLKRGSYFAVIHGAGLREKISSSKRYGEDEILIIKKKINKGR